MAHAPQAYSLAEPKGRLFTEIEFCDERFIAINTVTAQIVEQTASFTDHFEKPDARVVVFHMCLKMAGQSVDFFSQQGHLDLYGTGVFRAFLV